MWSEISSCAQFLNLPELSLQQQRNPFDLGFSMKRACPEGGHKEARMEGVQRYLVTVEYVGTRFSGWQKQEGMRTVQGTLESAFSKFVGHPVTSAGSSRTDTGVHALGNVCHVDAIRTSKRKPGEMLTPHAPDVVVKAVNHYLQRDNVDDLQLVHAKLVPSDFHARFKAKGRTYFYRIVTGSMNSLFEKDRVWHVNNDLDLKAMQSACQVLIGNHDFSSFRASGCQANSPIRTLEVLSVEEVPNWRGISLVPFGNPKPKSYIVTAKAQSFLYHQVRLMVGALKAVGSGSRSIQELRDILEARSISSTPPMAPACGLYLAEVEYEQEQHLGLEPQGEGGSAYVHDG